MAVVPRRNGKNELIHTRRCDDVIEVEIATFEWVSWWNQTRIHQALDYRTPVEDENDYWHSASTSEEMKTRANARNKTRDTSVGRTCEYTGYRLL